MRKKFIFNKFRGQWTKNISRTPTCSFWGLTLILPIRIVLVETLERKFNLNLGKNEQLAFGLLIFCHNPLGGEISIKFQSADKFLTTLFSEYFKYNYSLTRSLSSKALKRWSSGTIMKFPYQSWQNLLLKPAIYSKKWYGDKHTSPLSEF